MLYVICRRSLAIVILLFSSVAFTAADDIKTFPDLIKLFDQVVAENPNAEAKVNGPIKITQRHSFWLKRSKILELINQQEVCRQEAAELYQYDKEYETKHGEPSYRIFKTKLNQIPVIKIEKHRPFNGFYLDPVTGELLKVRGYGRPCGDVYKNHTCTKNEVGHGYTCVRK